MISYRNHTELIYVIEIRLDFWPLPCVQSKGYHICTEEDHPTDWQTHQMGEKQANTDKLWTASERQWIGEPGRPGTATVNCTASNKETINHVWMAVCLQDNNNAPNLCLSLRQDTHPAEYVGMRSLTHRHTNTDAHSHKNCLAWRQTAINKYKHACGGQYHLIWGRTIQFFMSMALFLLQHIGWLSFIFHSPSSM